MRHRTELQHVRLGRLRVLRRGLLVLYRREDQNPRPSRALGKTSARVPAATDGMTIYTESFCTGQGEVMSKAAYTCADKVQTLIECHSSAAAQPLPRPLHAC